MFNTSLSLVLRDQEGQIMNNLNSGTTLKSHVRTFFLYQEEGFFVPFFSRLPSRYGEKTQRNTEESQ